MTFRTFFHLIMKLGLREKTLRRRLETLFKLHQDFEEHDTERIHTLQR